MKYKIDGQFAPMPEKLLNSRAWAAAGVHVRRLVDFLLAEHLSHGGQQNGKLHAPWRQLSDRTAGARIPERFITKTIGQAVALGLVDVHRGTRRQSSTYALTWLPLYDGTPPNNRFLECDAVADAILAAAKQAKRRSTSWRRDLGLPTQSEGKVCPHKVKANTPTQSEGKGTFLPTQSEGKTPDFEPTQSEGTIYKALPGQGQDKNRCIRDDLVRGDALVGVVADQPGGNSGSSLGKDDHEDGGQAVEPTRACGRYVTVAVGHRICGKPSLVGMDRCAEHVLRLVNA
jgi:hypothetical protein